MTDRTPLEILGTLVASSTGRAVIEQAVKELKAARRVVEIARRIEESNVILFPGLEEAIEEYRKVTEKGEA